MPKPQTISPNEVAQKLAKGATLIDIRSPDEFARMHIGGAVCVPIDSLDKDSIANQVANNANPQGGQNGENGENGENIVIFHCLSGMRTAQNADKITAYTSNCTAYIMDGGLQAWQKAGLPTVIDRTQPISLIKASANRGRGADTVWCGARLACVACVLWREWICRGRATICRGYGLSWYGKSACLVAL